MPQARQASVPPFRTPCSSRPVLCRPPLGAAEVKSAAALKKPVVLRTLSKEQIKALPDNDPIDVDGKITTKAQVLAEIHKIKPQADAWVAQKASAAQARFQKMQRRLRGGPEEQDRVEQHPRARRGRPAPPVDRAEDG